MSKITVQDTEITVVNFREQDYICLTDIAKHKSDDPNAVIGNWMRNRNTIEYLGIWEILYNPDFKPLEFEGFRLQAGLNAFTLSPSKWVKMTDAKGIVVKSGHFGGTYAHKDIAFKFASWVSSWDGAPRENWQRSTIESIPTQSSRILFHRSSHQNRNLLYMQMRLICSM